MYFQVWWVIPWELLIYLLHYTARVGLYADILEERKEGIMVEMKERDPEMSITLTNIRWDLRQIDEYESE